MQRARTTTFRRRLPRSLGARGSVVLEIVIALAIVVAAAGAVMATVDRATSSAAGARDVDRALDLARTAISLLEASIVTPEALNGPITGWLGVSNDSGGLSLTAGWGVAPPDGTFADAPPPSNSGWELEIETEPATFTGLTRVRVTATLRDGDSIRSSATLLQLIRLGADRKDELGQEDDLTKAARRAGESAGARLESGRGSAFERTGRPRPPSTGNSPEGEDPR